MNYAEVLENARKNIGPNCKACSVCNGLACGNTIPGPGSKAPGNGANDKSCMAACETRGIMHAYGNGSKKEKPARHMN